ncbi:hypothetical protein TNCV_1107851 [Trichonephila clavipes]|nr:hypothetical protein TNCV_1107851 [Trichonephila clavipes]
MMLKAKANDLRKNLALSRDEFRGPSSDITVDQYLYFLVFFNLLRGSFILGDSFYNKSSLDHIEDSCPGDINDDRKRILCVELEKKDGMTLGLIISGTSSIVKLNKMK